MHKLLLVVLLMGRTGRNMATFRDKQAGAEEWAGLAATVADGVVSEHVLSSVPGSYEANPLFGKHPSQAKYLTLTVPIGFYSSVLTQYTHEHYDSQPSQWRAVLPAAITIGIHSGAIAFDEHELRVTCEKAQLRCG